MESTYSLIGPNMNAEEYRNITATNSQPMPDKQLQVIKIFKDNSMLIGASNMIDRNWNGTLSYYNNIKDCSKETAPICMRTESGIADAAYLGKSDRFLIGEDSGTIQIIELAQVENNECQQKTLQSLNYACQHDDSLISLSIFQDNKHFVSGGMDCCIKVWDAVDELLSTYSFNPAHSDTVTCVDVKPSDNSVFASTSLDSEALIWDIRKSTPAHGLFKRNNCGLTAVNWKPDSDNILAIGTEDGSIFLIDIRKSNNELIYTVDFNRGVYKLEFNPETPNQLAGCCDGNIVKVFDIDRSLAILYQDSRHQDFVRGLAWYRNKLFTCSWDNTVLENTLTEL